MGFWEALLLGLIQGLTEFLPVSSSGHLAIFQKLLGGNVAEAGMTYGIMLHVATLFSVFAVYYKDIWELIKAFFALIGDVFRGKVNLKENENQKLVLMLIIATIPAGITGVVFGDLIEDLFGRYLILVGLMLILTAVLLFVSDRVKPGGKTAKNLKFREAIIPGLFQAVAIVPGLSRSGSTITGALFAGFKRKFAVKFSFLLSIPIILGAAAVDAVKLMKNPTETINFLPAISGMAVAAIVGFLSIKFMLKLISNNKFHYFSYYCLVAGILTVVLSFF